MQFHVLRKWNFVCQNVYFLQVNLHLRTLRRRKHKTDQLRFNDFCEINRQ